MPTSADYTKVVNELLAAQAAIRKAEREVQVQHEMLDLLAKVSQSIAHSHKQMKEDLAIRDQQVQRLGKFYDAVRKLSHFSDETDEHNVKIIVDDEGADPDGVVIVWSEDKEDFTPIMGD